MHFGTLDFTTIEDGIKELERIVNLRDSMCGSLYYNMLNEDTLRIADKLVSMGADKEGLMKIIGTWDYR